LKRWRRCFLPPKPKAAGGKPTTPGVENQRLMLFEYLREYRTYFHIGQTRGISESAAYRNIKWCENTLAKSKSFRLPDRTAVAAGDRAVDAVLIDATETPIERPKKTAPLFGQDEAAHPENPACCREINAPHSLHCARKWAPARIQAVREVKGPAAAS
jgi:Helix-turn-helix of DDE superfamily endonuclease